MYLYGHVYYNVVDHPAFLFLHFDMPPARVVYLNFAFCLERQNL